MKVKEESEKFGLELNIQKTKIMASGPITSWQIDTETLDTVADFIFLGSEIIADGDCSHEIKRCLLLGRNAMTNLDSILKSRDITLPTKICLVNAIIFPVVMYGCESWTIKKAECWRIGAFEPVVLEKTLESLLDCKEIQPVQAKGNQSLEGLMLKLKLQYFCHLMWRVDSFKKTLMLGKIEGRRRRGWQRMRWLDGITDSMDMGWVDSRSWWWTGRPGVLWFVGSQIAGHNLVTELNWTELNTAPMKTQSKRLSEASWWVTKPVISRGDDVLTPLGNCPRPFTLCLFLFGCSWHIFYNKIIFLSKMVSWNLWVILVNYQSWRRYEKPCIFNWLGKGKNDPWDLQMASEVS